MFLMLLVIWIEECASIEIQSFTEGCLFSMSVLSTNNQALVVWKVEIAIHWINHYAVDSVVCFVNTYPLDSNLSGG